MYDWKSFIIYYLKDKYKINIISNILFKTFKNLTTIFLSSSIDIFVYCIIIIIIIYYVYYFSVKSFLSHLLIKLLLLLKIK